MAEGDAVLDGQIAFGAKGVEIAGGGAVKAFAVAGDDLGGPYSDLGWHDFVDLVKKAGIIHQMCLTGWCGPDNLGVP